MILNTGSRTDIPAFYSDWLAQRLKEGYVIVRSPYDPDRLTRYKLSPDVVDVMAFCTKNPEPMLKYEELWTRFRTFWMVTITPYGQDLEPGVPPVTDVIESVRKLSSIVGQKRVFWRYDPIILNHAWSKQDHYKAFEQMCKELEGCVDAVIFSFVDLYEKTLRNMKGVKDVHPDDMREMTYELCLIAGRYHLKPMTCAESPELAMYGADVTGCMSQAVLEDAFGIHLDVPKKSRARKTCDCLLGDEIGAYNTCKHGCQYCYATWDHERVRRVMHDPMSPILTGRIGPQETIREARQESWLSDQLTIFDF